MFLKHGITSCSFSFVPLTVRCETVRCHTYQTVSWRGRGAGESVVQLGQTSLYVSVNHLNSRLHLVWVHSSSHVFDPLQCFMLLLAYLQNSFLPHGVSCETSFDFRRTIAHHRRCGEKPIRQEDWRSQVTRPATIDPKFNRCEEKGVQRAGW
jgi:hypothetical protein